LALDMVIRKASSQQRSLDDVVRLIWQRYGQRKLGVPEGMVEQLVEEVAGIALGEFFECYVYGTEELPLHDFLADMGVQFSLRPRVSQQDKGGKVSLNLQNGSSIGINGVYGLDGLRVTTVYSDSAAEKAGIAAGDTLIALNGLRFPVDWESVIASLPQGQNISIYGFRRDEWRSYIVKLQAIALDTVMLSVQENDEMAKVANRQAWLGEVNDKM